MSLKRKRSLPSLTLHLPSPPTTSPASNGSDSTRWSTSPQTSPSPPPLLSTKASHYPSHLWDSGEGEDRHLDSRTRKRFRDARPDQSEVYRNTLGRLFGAQRQPQQHQFGSSPPPTAQQSIQDSESTDARRGPRQASLHNFWALPSSRRSAPVPSHTHHEAFENPRCEDCDRPVREVRQVTNLGDCMDIDGGTAADGLGNDADLQCSMCGRLVCVMCAVHGDRRVCLGCVRQSGGEQIWGC